MRLVLSETGVTDYNGVARWLFPGAYRVESAVVRHPITRLEYVGLCDSVGSCQNHSPVMIFVCLTWLECVIGKRYSHLAGSRGMAHSYFLSNGFSSLPGLVLARHVGPPACYTCALG